MKLSDDQVRAALNRIELLISEKEMTKSDFYKKSRISSALFSQWNTQLYKPTEKSLKKAADALGVTVQYLLTGEEQQKKPTTVLGDGLKAEFVELFSRLSPEEQAREIAYLRERVASQDN